MKSKEVRFLLKHRNFLMLKAAKKIKCIETHLSTLAFRKKITHDNSKIFNNQYSNYFNWIMC